MEIQNLIDAMRKLARQRPRLNPHSVINYTDISRKVASQRHQAERLIDMAAIVLNQGNLPWLVDALNRQAFNIQHECADQSSHTTLRYIAAQNYGTEYRAALICALDAFLGRVRNEKECAT